MKPSIIAKLRAVLNSGIDSECKVVYVIAECRKLLETYPPDPKPFALQLYFHWALHLNLTQDHTTKNFLKRVDAYVASVFAGNSDIAGEHRMTMDFGALHTFRQELGPFLRAYNLPTDVCDHDPLWDQFVEQYSGVIEDGSLTCTDKDLELMLIDSVVFKKSNRPGIDRVLPFDMQWEMFKEKKKVLTVDAYTFIFPGGERANAFGIRLP